MTRNNRNAIAPALVAGVGAALAVWALRRRHAPINFVGRVVVITGGSRGLGLVMARLLAKEGAKISLLARDGDELKRAEQDVAGESKIGAADVLTIVCDVTRREHLEEAITRVVDRFGRLDVLINNAGVIAVAPFEHQTDADFEKALATHLWAPLHAVRAALPHLKKAASEANGAARIVNIASFGGKVGVPHMAAYCASKHALVGFSDVLRAELAKDNIRVTTVSPGVLRTGSHLNAEFKGQHEKEYAWFALGTGNPLLSLDALSAAKQILEAARRGDSHLVQTAGARAATVLNAVTPDLVALVMELANRALPAPAPAGEPANANASRTGWQSRDERLAPPTLSHLADKATTDNNGLKGHAEPV